MPETITTEEFSRQLRALSQAIFEAYNAYRLSLALWHTPENIETINYWLDFLLPVKRALYVDYVLGLAKVLDNDKRTMSLLNLLRIAKANALELVPDRTPEDVQGLIEKILDHQKVLESIKQKRDQQLAHLDANPDPAIPLVKGEVDGLIQTLAEVFDKLLLDAETPAYLWETQIRRSEEATDRVMGILRQTRDD